MNRHMTWLASAAVAAFAGAALAQSASAGTIAYEEFDYSAGTFLPGQSGGQGWSGAWVGTQGAGSDIEYQNTAAITPNFTYPDLTTEGNRARVQGGTISRQLADGALGAAGSTVWFSFDGMLNSWLGNSNLQLGLAFTNNGTQVLSIGQGSGGLWSIPHSDNNSWVLATTLGDATDQTRIIDAHDGGLNGGTALDQFFVGKIQFFADHSEVDVWANPDLSGAAPTNADAHSTDSNFHAFTFDGVLLSDSQHDGGPQFDEIRIGTDFASVVSNVAAPEPTSLALLGLGGLATLKRGRRRKA